MTKHHFCTLFDSNYLLKGVAMIQSLQKFCPGAHIHVLCMDDEVRSILAALGIADLTLIPLHDIETEALLKAKGNRGPVEYCWTLSSCLPWYVLDTSPNVDIITYLDADLLFYSPLAPLFDEIGNASIAIIEHRFSERLKDREVNGRFCVEWVSFRRDAEGMACLSRWREQCIEWCYYRLEDGKMGDQKYLDEWPYRYASCHILQHPGAGIAPWNYSKYRFAKDTDGNITVDGLPLIFYHFHQFQLLPDGKFDRLSKFYTSECKEPDDVYAAYESAITHVLQRVRAHFPTFNKGTKPRGLVSGRRLAQRFLPHPLKEFFRNYVRY